MDVSVEAQRGEVMVMDLGRGGAQFWVRSSAFKAHSPTLILDAMVWCMVSPCGPWCHQYLELGIGPFYVVVALMKGSAWHRLRHLCALRKHQLGPGFLGPRK